MDELFASGYCRAMDCSRTVTAEKEDSLWRTDCAAPDCPYCGSCPIIKALEEKAAALLKELDLQ